MYFFRIVAGETRRLIVSFDSTIHSHLDSDESLVRTPSFGREYCSRSLSHCARGSARNHVHLQGQLSMPTCRPRPADCVHSLPAAKSTMLADGQPHHITVTGGLFTWSSIRLVFMAKSCGATWRCSRRETVVLHLLSPLAGRHGRSLCTACLTAPGGGSCRERQAPRQLIYTVSTSASHHPRSDVPLVLNVPNGVNSGLSLSSASARMRLLPTNIGADRLGSCTRHEPAPLHVRILGAGLRPPFRSRLVRICGCPRHARHHFIRAGRGVRAALFVKG